MTDTPDRLPLGGHAWAHPGIGAPLEPTNTLTTYPGNPRRGDQDAITASIRDLGLYRALIAQRSTRRILAGNHTYRALMDLGATEVPVTWVNVDDVRAAALVARDNRTSDLGVYDDEELLALLTSHEEVLALSGYDEADLAALRGADDAGLYTRKANAIHYEPTMDAPPPVDDLVDRRKADALVEAVVEAGLPDAVRDFLVAGAQRHLVFDYAAIAEYYAHATPEVQALMEASALVIVDFEDAIWHGYVRLSKRLSKLLGQTQAEDREARDA